MLGTIKVWHQSKGYGFISHDGRDLFFRDLDAISVFLEFVEGETVEFSLVEGPNGPKATSVAKVS